MFGVSAVSLLVHFLDERCRGRRMLLTFCWPWEKLFDRTRSRFEERIERRVVFHADSKKRVAHYLS